MSLRSPNWLGKNLLVAAAVVALLLAMALDTKFLSPKEAAALNPPAFNAKTYVDKAFPTVVDKLTEEATDITVLAPAIAEDPAAAGEQYGTDTGSGRYAFPVKATGTVAQVDADFILLKVPGLPEKDEVRIPLGAALSGTPVRDAPGTITFSDFVGQTEFQSVANQFKLKIQAEVISALNPESLEGKTLTVVGAWSSGGPPRSYIIQPVSVTVGP